MVELEMLGYKTPRTVKHQNGIEIIIPEDRKSNKWCVYIPSNLIGNDKYCNNGLTFYDVSYAEVINIVFKYSNKDERDKYLGLKVNKSKKKHPLYDEVMENRAEGMTYREIGEKIGYSYQAIYNIVNSK